MIREDDDAPLTMGPPLLEEASDKVIARESPKVMPERLQVLKRVAYARIPSVALVLDALGDPHNVAAILRSGDALGVQQFHFVAGDTERERQPRARKKVSKGVDKWLDVHWHREVDACVSSLRSQGFSLWGASMEGTQGPEVLQPLPRVALVFGNEHRGVRPALRASLDGVFSVPMRGFVESLNVSVAAALSTYLACVGRPSVDREAGDVMLARFLLNQQAGRSAALREARADSPCRYPAPAVAEKK